jgi:hypothetical protein
MEDHPERDVALELKGVALVPLQIDAREPSLGKMIQD